MRLLSSKFITSPITRARQTAEIIADEIGAKIIFRDELTARDQGEATGLTEEEVRELKPKGVEPLENVKERAAKFLKGVIQKDEDAIVVTHKKVIQMMLSYILNMNPADALKFAVENAHFVKLRYNGLLDDPKFEFVSQIFSFLNHQVLDLTLQIHLLYLSVI